MENLFIATGTLALPGLLTALSVFAAMLLSGQLLKIVGYHVWVDIIFSVGLCLMYAGTYNGMIAAFIGGLTLSILLWLVNRIFGYYRWSWNEFKWIFHTGW